MTVPLTVWQLYYFTTAQLVDNPQFAVNAFVPLNSGSPLCKFTNNIKLSKEKLKREVALHFDIVVWNIIYGWLKFITHEHSWWEINGAFYKLPLKH